MISNTYTCAVENIHVPAAAVERAIREAKRRAAAPPPLPINSRVIATAASLVLVSAAGAGAYLFYNQAQPPVTNNSVVSESQPAPTDSSTEPVKDHQAQNSAAATERSTPSAVQTENNTAAQEQTAQQSGSAQSDTKKPSPSSPQSSQATEAQTTSTVETVEIDGAEIVVPQIDRSQLAADGKVFFALAATGMDYINSPGAFSDDHLCFIETKWGRVTVRPIQTLSLTPIEPYGQSYSATPDQSAALHYYYYNSNGRILYTGTVYR